MTTPSASVRWLEETSQRSLAWFPIAILLALFVLSLTKTIVHDDPSAWAEVLQLAG